MHSNAISREPVGDHNAFIGYPLPKSTTGHCEKRKKKKTFIAGITFEGYTIVLALESCHCW